MSDLRPTGDCAAVRAELSPWVDGELGPWQRTAVERHLAVCSACRAEAALLRLVSQAARQVPRLEPREERRGRVMERVRAEAAGEPAAARHAHRVEIRVTERPGAYVVHRQEWGASPAPVGTPLPDLIARPASRARVEWQQHGSGGSTMSYQVTEVG